MLKKRLLLLFVIFTPTAVWAAWLMVYDSDRDEWFWLSALVRPALIESIEAAPGIRSISIPGGYYDDLKVNDIDISHAYKRQSELGLSRTQLEDILGEARRGWPESVAPFTKFRDIARELRSADFIQFASIYGHGKEGLPVSWPGKHGRKPVGLAFFPTSSLKHYWYYSLDGNKPPKTETGAILFVSGNWYRMLQ